MITVDLYVLNGHAPSANIGRIVDLYLGSCPGVILRKTTVNSRAELMDVMGRRKVPAVPSLEVPGDLVHGRKQRKFISDQKDIEDWCRETVQQIDSANRGRRRR
jgi:hypothetical protein